MWSSCISSVTWADVLVPFSKASKLELIPDKNLRLRFSAARYFSSISPSRRFRSMVTLLTEDILRVIESWLDRLRRGQRAYEVLVRKRRWVIVYLESVKFYPFSGADRRFITIARICSSAFERAASVTTELRMPLLGNGIFGTGDKRADDLSSRAAMHSTASAQR